MASFEITGKTKIEEFENKIIFSKYAKSKFSEDSYKTLAYVSVVGNSKIYAYDTVITKKDDKITGIIQAGNSSFKLKDIKKIKIAPVVLIRVFEYQKETDITEEYEDTPGIWEPAEATSNAFQTLFNSTPETTPITITKKKEAEWITNLIGTDSITTTKQRFLVCSKNENHYLFVMLEPTHYVKPNLRKPQSIKDFQMPPNLKRGETVKEVFLRDFFGDKTKDNKITENAFSKKYRMIANFTDITTEDYDLTPNGIFYKSTHDELKEYWDDLKIDYEMGVDVEISSLYDEKMSNSSIAWESSRIDKLERELDLLIDTLAPPFVVSEESGEDEGLGFCPTTGEQANGFEAQFLASGDKIKMLGDKLLDSSSGGAQVNWPSQYRLPRYLLPPNKSDSIDDSKNVWIQIFKDYLNQSNLAADLAIANWNSMWGDEKIKKAFTTPLSEITTHETDPVI